MQFDHQATGSKHVDGESPVYEPKRCAESSGSVFFLEVNTMPDGGFDEDNDGGAQWFATVGQEQQQQQEQPAANVAESE